MEEVAANVRGSQGRCRPKKLLTLVREAIRRRHMSSRTEESYVSWIKRYIYFHGKRHPATMGEPEVEAFLTHLAVEGKVAASTQNQAFSALLFLYRDVLGENLQLSGKTVRAQRPKRLPTVLTKDEAFKIIGCMQGRTQLMAKLLYGSGLRLAECVRLRVKDLDFAQRQILVRDGKGMQDRVTMLPERLAEPLQIHLKQMKFQHEQDMAAGYGSTYLPYALARKYPNADKQWAWQYVFPSTRLSPDRESGVLHRFHMSESTLQKAVAEATRKAKINKRVSPPLNLEIGRSSPPGQAVQNAVGKGNSSSTFRRRSFSKDVALIDHTEKATQFPISKSTTESAFERL